MNQIWNFTIDDYLQICERAKAKGIKEGESMEEVLCEYVKEKNIKSIGMTELTKEEFIKEQMSHGKNVLEVETDKEGKSKYKFKKGETNNE